jgi:uncharacterized protein YndB with AHSA1/START domain
MNETTVTIPNELEIRVERIFDAPRAHVFSVWTDPKLIPEWWGDGTVVEEMDVRPGGTYRFRTAYGDVEGEFREVEPPARLVQTFQNHLQTLEFEDLGGDRTKLTQTMRFATTEERDTTMQYGVEEGAKGGFARVDELLQRLSSTREGGRQNRRRVSRDGVSCLLKREPATSSSRFEEVTQDGDDQASSNCKTEHQESADGSERETDDRASAEEHSPQPLTTGGSQPRARRQAGTRARGSQSSAALRDREEAADPGTLNDGEMGTDQGDPQVAVRKEVVVRGLPRLRDRPAPLALSRRVQKIGSEEG